MPSAMHPMSCPVLPLPGHAHALVSLVSPHGHGLACACACPSVLVSFAPVPEPSLVSRPLCPCMHAMHGLNHALHAQCACPLYSCPSPCSLLCAACLVPQCHLPLCPCAIPLVVHAPNLDSTPCSSHAQPPLVSRPCPCMHDMHGLKYICLACAVRMPQFLVPQSLFPAVRSVPPSRSVLCP